MIDLSACISVATVFVEEIEGLKLGKIPILIRVGEDCPIIHVANDHHCTVIQATLNGLKHFEWLFQIHDRHTQTYEIDTIGIGLLQIFFQTIFEIIFLKLGLEEMDIPTVFLLVASLRDLFIVSKGNNLGNLRILKPCICPVYVQDIHIQTQMCASNCYAEMAAEKLKKNAFEETWDILCASEEKYLCSDLWFEVHNDLYNSLQSIRPSNGKVLKSTLSSGYGEFTVKADNEDVCVKLESISNPDKYLLMYVHKFDSATAQVGDGEYIAKYTTGENWFGNESMFGSEASFSKAEDVIAFETEYSGNSVYYSSISITIYKVANGNLETTPIDAEQF